MRRLAYVRSCFRLEDDPGESSKRQFVWPANEGNLSVALRWPGNPATIAQILGPERPPKCQRNRWIPYPVDPLGIPHPTSEVDRVSASRPGVLGSPKNSPWMGHGMGYPMPYPTLSAAGHSVGWMGYPMGYGIGRLARVYARANKITR